MKNDKKFNEYITLLSEKYDKQISAGMAKMIRKAIKPYADEQCVRSLESVILHGEYYSNLLPDLMKQLEESNEDKALLAWGAFFYELKNYNGISLQFSDPVVHSIVEAMGGMEVLSMTEDKDIKWVRKEFLELYRPLHKRRDHPLQITGVHDANNLARGFMKFIAGPKQVLIGGPQEMKQIEEG